MFLAIRSRAFPPEDRRCMPAARGAYRQRDERGATRRYDDDHPTMAHASRNRATDASDAAATPSSTLGAPGRDD
jgi:hypothetical protein